MPRPAPSPHPLVGEDFVPYSSEFRVRVEVWGAEICVPRTALSPGMTESPGHIASCVCHPRAPPVPSRRSGIFFLGLGFQWIWPIMAILIWSPSSQEELSASFPSHSVVGSAEG